MNRYDLSKLLLAGSGALALKWHFLSPGLYVFNYHRIGDSGATAFDPNVFSCDEKHFDAQLEVIDSRFRVINSNELLEIIEHESKITEPLAMITFDDGYEDNYSKAFPLLVRRGLPAIFFLPTSFIGTSKIPWWDAAAWLVRNSGEKNIQLSGLSKPIVIDSANADRSIRNVLIWFKELSGKTSKEKLDELSGACKCKLNVTAASTLFMNWDQVREMKSAGMDIGSHTQSHHILANLTLDEQREELSKSKRLLESELDTDINILAYPVGGVHSYTSSTTRVVRECGYRAAFNFLKGGGYNPDPSTNPFELARISMKIQALPIDIKMCTVSLPRIP